MAFTGTMNAPDLFDSAGSARRAAERARRAEIDTLPPMQRNAVLIADEEKEWSQHGPLREISYLVSLREEAQADALALDAVKHGFTVEISRWPADERYRFKLKALRKMLPETGEMTRWQGWFEDRAGSVPTFLDEYGMECPGAETEGWSYPDKLQPTFWVDEKPMHAARQHRSASALRTRILFGDNLCKFEASNGWAGREGAKKAGAFQLVPSAFIKNARSRRPKDPEPTASAFSQWLYSLYANASGDDRDMHRGVLAEKEILAKRRKAFSGIDFQTMQDRFPGWRLKQNGMNVSWDGPPPYFTIPELAVGGQALRVLPDLIFENWESGAQILVEIKHSYMTIPTNLWPNLWGQLWCYSQMTDVRVARDVTIIGEVWGDRTLRRGENRAVYLRASVRRNPRHPAFDRFFRTLFDIYRGA